MSRGDRESTQQFQIAPEPMARAGRRAVLTVLSGPKTGLVVEVPMLGLEVGRALEPSLGDDSLSRRHARFFPLLGAVFVEDLHSTNGTYVEGQRIQEPTRLTDGARVQLGRSTLLRFALRDEAELVMSQRLYESMSRDALTGLYNRAFLDERLVSELAFARRHGTPLAVLFVDADHFKRVNDTHGHAAGDEVLRALGKYLGQAMRTEDVAARYGGEEFVLVLRGIDEAGVRTVAERVRASIEKLWIEHGGVHIPVTVSIGVAIHSPARAHAGVAQLLAAADGALYRAKADGRNRVVVA